MARPTRASWHAQYAPLTRSTRASWHAQLALIVLTTRASLRAQRAHHLLPHCDLVAEGIEPPRTRRSPPPGAQPSCHTIPMAGESTRTAVSPSGQSTRTAVSTRSRISPLARRSCPLDTPLARRSISTHGMHVNLDTHASHSGAGTLTVVPAPFHNCGQSARTHQSPEGSGCGGGLALTTTIHSHRHSSPRDSGRYGGLGLSRCPPVVSHSRS